MTDREQTIEETQPGSPGADAPGDGVQHAGEAQADGGIEDAPTDAALEQDVSEIEGDLDELVKTTAQRDEYLALAQRTQADFENYRKRVARESASAQARGVLSLAKELLPAIDNLDRALAAAAENDPLLDGVRLVR